MRKFVYACVSLLLLAGCGNDTKPDGKTLTKADSPAKADSARILAMPAPLQVCTWMHEHAGAPEPALLADFSTGLHCETEYSKSLCLGILLSDIGYLSLYNQRQPALDRIALAEEVMKGLRLDNTFSALLPRLNNNIDNRDSLSFLVLTLYSESSRSLNASGRENTALYITSGCFLEGFALTLSSSKMKEVKEYNELLGQQKIWLDNLAEAVSYLPQEKDSQDLFNTFYTLQHYFEPVKIEMLGNRPYVIFTSNQILPLKDKAVQLRNDALKG